MHDEEVAQRASDTSLQLSIYLQDATQEESALASAYASCMDIWSQNPVGIEEKQHAQTTDRTAEENDERDAIWRGCAAL